MADEQAWAGYGTPDHVREQHQPDAATDYRAMTTDLRAYVNDLLDKSDEALGEYQDSDYRDGIDRRGKIAEVLAIHAVANSLLIVADEVAAMRKAVDVVLVPLVKPDSAARFAEQRKRQAEQQMGRKT